LTPELKFTLRESKLKPSVRLKKFVNPVHLNQLSALITTQILSSNLLLDLPSQPGRLVLPEYLFPTDLHTKTRRELPIERRLSVN
jgi:hypothetical protein